MSKKYVLIDKFLGYSNKADITNVDPRYLVAGSQNVIINDQEKVGIRYGYTIDGTADTALTPVVSSYDWITSTGVERNLKHYSTKLTYRYVDSSNVVTWRDIGLTFGATAELQFTDIYSSTEAKDLLVFVDNLTANLYMWSGGVATFASATVNTVTKQGTETWAESRFLVAGTRTIIIGGVSATYTGGEGTTTLTGVSVDFSATSVGAVIHQGVRTTATTPASGIQNGLVGTLRNQLYVADRTLRTVYVSKNTDYTDFTTVSPRVPGGAAVLTIDAAPTAFIAQEQDMYISGGKDFWFKTTFTLSADLVNEDLKIDRLKTGPLQGALSQSAVGKIKNSVLFMSFEKTIDDLGRVENINTPESRPLSDIIQLELLGYDVTIPPHILYAENRAHIMFPSESKMLIYEFDKGYWQAPQIIPGRRLAIIGGEVYFHSNATPDTYKLFDSTADNGNPINAIAAFAYRNYGKRYQKKVHDEWYVEGYISSNTVLNSLYYYDFGGYTQILNRSVNGSDTNRIYSTAGSAALGVNPFGSQPFGSITNADSTLRKFRAVHTFNEQNYFEIQSRFYTNEIDAQWELLAQGGNIRESDKGNKEIKDEDN